MKKMKKTIYIFATLAMFFMTTQWVSAQKFGHINSAALLAEMPEIKTADAQLNSFQEGLVSKGQQMMQALQEKYNAYLEQANTGTLSQVQMQQKEGELATEQQEIQKYEYDVQNQIAAKREELYQPIFDKVQQAIEEIGQQEGYTMIFDASSGAILSENNAEDLMSKVKSKLGI